MESFRALRTSDLPAGTMKKVTRNGKTILIANLNGTFCALNGQCPHLGGSLAEGMLENGVVICPRHGAQFDLRTGAAVGKAKMGPLRIMPKNAETYEVEIEAETVVVRLP